MKGYEALREAAAWMDLQGRGTIRVMGEDRARLLHAMTTNHVEQLKAGQGCYAFFLSAQGRILGDAAMLCRADDFILDTEPETKQKLYDHLDKFIIADDVTLEDLTDEWMTVAVEGPRAEEILRAVGAPVPDTEYSHCEWEPGGMVARLSYCGGPGFYFMGPEGGRPAVLAALKAAGAVEADLEAAQIVRIENGKPRYGEDITERYLAQETNQMQALHFSKGCYLGQEIVERVRSRGQLHRRLLPLHIEGNEPPQAGTKLQSDGKDAAEISSAAYSPALGRTVALAYVRMDYKPGDHLTWGERTATVLASPGRSTVGPDECR